MVDVRRRLGVVATWCEGRFWPARALLLIWFVSIGVRHLADPLYTSLFGALNLAIHEAGHLVFRFAGEFIMMVGGTILQLAAPVASAVLFLRLRERRLAVQQPLQRCHLRRRCQGAGPPTRDGGRG